MKPIDDKQSTCIDFCVENIDKNSKFKIDDYLRILKYKNIFLKSYTPNQSEEFFLIIKVENIVPLT